MKENTEKENLKKFVEEQDATAKFIENLESVEGETKSLGKVQMSDYEERRKEHEETVKKYGWVKLSLDNFPSRRRGLDFYKDGISIKIRSATTEQVRYWSEMDENDPFSVDEAFNDMLKNCCLVSYETGETGSYKDILEEDRIYVLLEIRKLTYPEPEQELVYDFNCESCGALNKAKLDTEYFRSVEIDPMLKKYYNHETKRFEVKTKSYGTIYLKPPSIGVMEAISHYVKEERRKKRKLDVSFVKILPFLLDDWRGLNSKKIKDLEVEYVSWDSKKFSLILNLCSRARVGIEEKLYVECESCHAEVAVPIQFPNGIKGLFLISNIFDELL